MKYFAYGSNLCTNRLRERVPSATFCQKAILYGFTLKFHKRSIDGSAKCNAFYTGNNTDEVHGVIFDIDEEEKQDLDKAEGRGRGYDQITIKVNTNGGVEEVFTYVANTKAIDDSLQPYSWYKDLVLSGAKEHSLHKAYIRRLELVQARQDPNKSRNDKQRRLILNS
ncbi:MAG: gamma-glutamylcyclotransferase [Acidobacteriota bacterium]|nr:gamma-glutamylcyclotransferase [Acidobacteriota bacterium]